MFNFNSYYIGQRPHILVADLDMLKQIMVKDFHIFVDREVCAAMLLIILTTSISNLGFAYTDFSGKDLSDKTTWSCF